MIDDTELTPKRKMRAVLASEDQWNAISKIETAVGPHLQFATAMWLNSCKNAGIDPQISTASLSMTLCTNMARLIFISAGMNAETVDVDVLHNLGDATHEFLSRAVDCYIRKSNAEKDRQN